MTQNPDPVLLVRASYDIIEQQTPASKIKRATGDFVSLLRAHTTIEDAKTYLSLQEIEIDGTMADRLLAGARILESDLRAAGKAARKARPLEFGADGGFMVRTGSPELPSHMPNAFNAEPLPLPLRALYALGCVLSFDGALLVGEGIASFECTWMQSGSGVTLGVKRSGIEACGFVFELGASGGFEREPVRPETPLRAGKGSYDTAIHDRTEGAGPVLFGQRVTYAATRHLLVDEDEELSLRDR